MPSLRQLDFSFTGSTIRAGVRGDVQSGTRCPQRVDKIFAPLAAGMTSSFAAANLRSEKPIDLEIVNPTKDAREYAVA